MFVIKRNGQKAPISFDEILRRIEYLSSYPYPLKGIDAASLTQEVISQLVSGIKTSEIDSFSARRSASKNLISLDYEILAARILIDNHHKNTFETFSEKMSLLQKESNGQVLANDFYEFVMKHSIEIDAKIVYERDFKMDYFGFNTLYSQSYLLRLNGKVIERPQDLFMRVALFIHYGTKNGLELAFETYDLLSEMYFIHASPTLFNSGLKRASCISCFLAATDDSKEGIQRVAIEAVNASASCGGIAFSASCWRSKGSLIKGSNDGHSDGIIPFIKWCQSGVDAFNQGGRRQGSLAVYLDVHHPDLIDFLKLRVHGGDETKRCRDVFLGLWISDLFMRRVMENGQWSFFDSENLNNLYGLEYEKLYLELEKSRKFKSQMRAREVWKIIFETKRDSGIPYILSKDTVNRTNNQKNIGMIKTSNLCAEIVEYCENLDSRTNEAETACCTLASIALPKFVEDARGIDNDFPNEPVFNYKKLAQIVHIIVRNLNNIIDKSYYPSMSTKRGNERHRPMGIGVQGLADVYFKFKIAFDSAEAFELNKRIFETIYYSAASKSALLAREIYMLNKSEFGYHKTRGAYPTFALNGGSPLANGKFNFELHGLQQKDLLQKHDWESLRGMINIYGIRNSLLIALMPTASTSQIFRNTECFEPLASNIYLRKVSGGEYFVINKYMCKHLEELGIRMADIIPYLKESAGSVQGLAFLPQSFRNVYKTAWELEQVHVVRQAADRQPFVDQSQSMNLYFENFDIQKFTASHITGWKEGLKTLSYYIRQRPAVRPMQITSKKKYVEPEREKLMLKSIEDLGCQVCGS